MELPAQKKKLLSHFQHGCLREGQDLLAMCLSLLRDQKAQKAHGLVQMH